jgi:hypothetical protein
VSILLITFDSINGESQEKCMWHAWQEKMNACRILMGKPQRKRPVGIPRRRWKDNIKMDLVAIGWSCMYWIDLAQGRDQWRALVNTDMNLRVP